MIRTLFYAHALYIHPTIFLANRVFRVFFSHPNTCSLYNQRWQWREIWVWPPQATMTLTYHVSVFSRNIFHLLPYKSFPDSRNMALMLRCWSCFIWWLSIMAKHYFFHAVLNWYKSLFRMRILTGRKGSRIFSFAFLISQGHSWWRFLHTWWRGGGRTWDLVNRREVKI